MGNSFSNLNIRKKESITVDDIKQYISQWMAAQQYLPAASEDEADASVAVISDNDSKWFSVYSNLFSFENPKSFSELAIPMSTALHSDILGILCFDSDYLYLNLIDATENIDARVEIGSDPDLGINRQTNLSAWKNKTVDYHRFKESVQKQYIFAEDALAELAPCIELPDMYSMASYSHLNDLDLGKSASYMHFKLSDNMVADEPPKLIPFMNSLNPYFLDQPHIEEVINSGRKSKGLSVYFLGSYVEDEDITFSDVSFVKSKNGQSLNVPIELKKIQLSDGQWAYYFHDPDFKILPKVDDRLPAKKRTAVEFERGICIRFVPHGNPRKILDITVALVPDENPDGMFSWNVLQQYGSKAELIAKYNESQCLPPECTPPGYEPHLLCEEDFD